MDKKERKSFFTKVRPNSMTILQEIFFLEKRMDLFVLLLFQPSGRCEFRLLQLKIGGIKWINQSSVMFRRAHLVD